jgi:hypothetical protein
VSDVLQLQEVLAVENVNKFGDSITTDGWTSDAGKGYQSLTLHVIDTNWKRRSFLLGAIRVVGAASLLPPHSLCFSVCAVFGCAEYSSSTDGKDGVNIAKHLRPVCEDPGLKWSQKGKLFFFGSAPPGLTRLLLRWGSSYKML